MRISNLHDLMRVRNYHFLTQTTKLLQLWWFDEKLINSLFDWPGWCSSSPWCWWLAPGTSPWCCGGGILTSLRLLQLRHGTSWQPPQPRLQGGEDRSPTQLSWLRMDTLERVTHFRDKILLRVKSLVYHWWQNVYPEVSIFPDILSLWKFQCFFPDQILTTTMAGTCQDQTWYLKCNSQIFLAKFCFFSVWCPSDCWHWSLVTSRFGLSEE